MTPYYDHAGVTIYHGWLVRCGSARVAGMIESVSIPSVWATSCRVAGDDPAAPARIGSGR